MYIINEIYTESELKLAPVKFYNVEIDANYYKPKYQEIKYLFKEPYQHQILKFGGNKGHFQIDFEMNLQIVQIDIKGGKNSILDLEMSDDRKNWFEVEQIQINNPNQQGWSQFEF